MKRILALVFAMIMMVMAAVPAFAAENSLVNSVEEKKTPELVGGVFLDKKGAQLTGAATLSLVAYGDADAAEDLGEAMEKAYNQILNKKSKSFERELKDIAKEKGGVVEQFTVTDLFGIDFDENSKVKGAKTLSVKMTPSGYYSAKEKPVVLFKQLGSNKWQLIEDVEFVGNDVVVNLPVNSGVVSFLKFDANKEVAEEDLTGWQIFWIVFGSVCCIGGIVCFVVIRKRLGK